MKEIKDIMLFNSGNLAVFDVKGKQIPKLQGNIICNLFKKAKRLGYKVPDNVEIRLPDGRQANKVKGYDNIEIK